MELFFDEPLLLAEDEIHFSGQPLAIVVAESNIMNKAGRKLIKVTCNQLPVI